MTTPLRNRTSKRRKGRFVKSVTDALRADGVDTDTAHVEKALRAAAQATTVPLTDAETAFFEAHSGLPADSTTPALEDIYADAVSDPESGFTITRHSPTLTTREVADYLDVDRTAVTRRAGKGLLHAVTRDGQMLFPTWQFTDTHHALPHLDRVLPHLPPEWGTYRVTQFFTTPTDLLDGLTPAQWLAQDGPPDDVVTVMVDEAHE